MQEKFCKKGVIDAIGVLRNMKVKCSLLAEVSHDEAASSWETSASREGEVWPVSLEKK